MAHHITTLDWRKSYLIVELHADDDSAAPLCPFLYLTSHQELKHVSTCIFGTACNQT